MPLDKKYTEHFTLVFEGDIRWFEKNPFQTDSPWGRPIASAMGNVMEENEDAEIGRQNDETERLRMALQQIVALDGFKDLMDAKSIAHRAITSRSHTDE